MATLQAKRAISRTNAKIKAMGQLDAFRLRIEAVMNAIEKEEFTLSETCYEICDIGQKIQRVSKIVRPLTVEGGAKNKKTNLQAKFRRQVDKNILNPGWLLAYCKNVSNLGYDDMRISYGVSSINLPRSLAKVNGWIVLSPKAKWLEENDKS